MRITTNAGTVILQLKQYRDNMNGKIHTLLERLAQIGVDTADTRFKTAQYDGDNDVTVTGPEWVGENKLVIRASGKSVLFIEFGSGLPGYGHPKAQDLGYGPGTYSDSEALGGKHHWDDPKGWFYKHDERSHGNPPARAMYDAGKEMRERVAEIAREVFRDD